MMFSLCQRITIYVAKRLLYNLSLHARDRPAGVSQKTLLYLGPTARVDAQLASVENAILKYYERGRRWSRG